MAKKRCSKCGVFKLLSAFGPSKQHKDGLKPWCRMCHLLSTRERRADPEHHKRREVMVLENGVPIARRCSKCHKVKSLTSFGIQKRPRQEDTAPHAWCKACGAAYRRMRRSLLPEHERCIRDKWREKFRDKFNAHVRQWNANHPEKVAEYAARKRAKKGMVAVADAKAMAAFIRYVRSARRIRCYWCHRWVPKSERHLDHVIPLQGRKLQGPHAPYNLCCACKQCNLSKSSKDPMEFSGQGELLLLPKKEAS